MALEKTIQRDSEAYRTWLCINLLSGASEKRLTVERIKNKLSFTCFFFFQLMPLGVCSHILFPKLRQCSEKHRQPVTLPTTTS